MDSGKGMDSGKFYLPLPVSEKINSSGWPLTRKKYTPAFKAKYVRQVGFSLQRGEKLR